MEKIDWSRFQYLARVLMALATAIKLMIAAKCLSGKDFQFPIPLQPGVSTTSTREPPFIFNYNFVSRAFLAIRVT